MNADDELDGLKRIRQVDAPPFLYTRIRSRIDALTEAPVPRQWVWTFAVGTALVLLLNVSALFSTTNAQSETGVDAVVNTMQLTNSNDLYHE